MKLKIYTNLEKLKLAPGFGYISPLIDCLLDEQSILHNYYELSSLEMCNFAVLPLSIDFLYDKNMQNYVNDFINNASKLNKKTIIFSGSDIGKTINHKDVITIRLGGYDSKLNKSTIIMPPFINDPYKFLNYKITYLDKKEIPEIGFVGHSNGSFSKFLKEFILFVKSNANRLIKKDATDLDFFYPSSYFRFKYLNIISKEVNCKTNFIFRKKYRAGATNDLDLATTTTDFFLNIFNNSYTFCMRGAGNFSVRLYETLAMGRIPVLINTNCRLPFNDEIDWKQHCVIIDQKDYKHIPEKIIEFHAKLSNNDFITLQSSNRQLWQNYFTKDNFFIKVSNQLKIHL